MSAEQDVPQWQRVADGIYGESFGHRSRKSVLETRIVGRLAGTLRREGMR
jgi:hypothetical protein